MSGQTAPGFDRLQALGARGRTRTWLVEEHGRPGVRFVLCEIDGLAADRREALALDWAARAALGHPNLSRVHCWSAGEHGGAWLCQAWVEGTDLAAGLHAAGPGAFVEHAAQALRGLGRLHDAGLAHGDLGPHAVRVRTEPSLGGGVVLLHGLPEGLVEPTEDELPFLAPERLAGAPATARADLYALGALVFTALHGRVPIAVRRGDRARFAAAARDGRRARPALPAGMPAGLNDWIEALLSPDPVGRPPDAGRALALLGETCGVRLADETPAGRAARLATGPPAGRSAELREVLESALAADGPVLTWVCGPADSGKTRLLDAVATAAVARGWAVRGPFRPPFARPALPHTGGPQLLVLDESERGVAADAEWLAALVGSAAGTPCLRVVAAVRPNEARTACMRGLLLAAGPLRGVRRVDLAPLSAEALGAMVARARAHAPDRKTADRLIGAGAQGFGQAARLLVAGAERGPVAERVAARDAEQPLADGREGLEAGADRERWVRAAIERALALGSHGHLAEALRTAREAEWQAALAADVELRAAATVARARCLVSAGQSDAAVAAISECGPDVAATHRARLAVVEARLAARQADSAELRVELEACLDTARAGDEPDVLPWCLLLEVERRAGTADEDPEPLRAALALCAARGPAWDQPFVAARSDLAAGAAALARGRLEQAAAAAEAARSRAAAGDLPLLAAEAAALLAEALQRSKHVDQAREAESDARRWLERATSRAGDPLLAAALASRPGLRRLRAPDESSAAERRLVALYDMGRALNEEADPERQLERILDAALAVVGGERGMIVLREDGAFRVRLARNLEQQTIEDAASFSRRVIEEAGSGRSVLSVDTGDDARMRELRSISLFGIRSVLCVPLRSRGRVIGAVYVDSRAGRASFGPPDLAFLEAFADHAALALDGARTRQELARENLRLRGAAEAKSRFGIVGASPEMRALLARIDAFVASDLPVLVCGESGTGKELVARAIHFGGPRRERPLVSANCAAVADTLMQSELFGHVRGAFTGADRDRQGLFELADGGTLFLDEVGDMSPGLQALLLRVLQDGKVRRVGGERQIPVDVRVVAATHRDLPAAVHAGRFREDLMYRLQVLVVHVPALRERDGDVPRLTEAFLERIGRDRGRRPPAVAPEALERLARHPWPGNVRQLESTLQRLALSAGDGPITAALVDLDPVFAGPAARTDEAHLSLERGERQQILRALESTSGNRSRAARLLGISRATLLRKVKGYDL